MAYIGRDIEYGSFTKQTLTANSSTTVFALDQSVIDANSILVSVGGVIQEPDVAYTASGTVLTFTGTPTTGDPIWIVYLGKTLGSSTTRDAITYQAATGNGSATTVAMTSSGTTGTIIVTLNGVMQTPSTDFSVSGSTLTFTTAPFNGAAIGIHYLGKQARLGVPASGTIQQADLASSGTFPAWDGSALTGLVGIMKADIFEIQNNIALLNFLRANDITAKRISMLNGFQDQFLQGNGVSNNIYDIPLSKFDGSSDCLETLDAFLGQSDGKSFILSFYMKAEMADGAQKTMFTTDNNRLQVYRSTDNKLGLVLENPSATEIAHIKSTRTITQSDGLVHCIIAIDMANTTVQMSINGAAVETNVVLTAVANDTIDFTNNFYIAKRASVYYQGLLGQIYLAQEYLDMSVQANRQKFYNSGAVDYGVDGSTPTGSQPLIYLNNNYRTFQDNLGTGGSFKWPAGTFKVDGGYVDIGASAHGEYISNEVYGIPPSTANVPNDAAQIYVSFIAKTSNPITKVGAKSSYSAAGGQTLSASIYADNGGAVGSLLSSVGTGLSVANNPGNGAYNFYIGGNWIDCTLPTPFTPTAGTKYWMKFTSTGTGVDIFEGNGGGLYSEGMDMTMILGTTLKTYPAMARIHQTRTNFTNSDDLLESFGKENGAANATISGGTTSKWGNAITFAYDLSLTKIAFHGKKTGSPTGTVFAFVTTVSGTPGTNGTGTDTVLARSNVVDIAQLDNNGPNGVIEFTFPEPFYMAAGNYFIGVDYQGGDASNFLALRYVAGGALWDDIPVTWANWNGTWNFGATLGAPMYIWGNQNLDLKTKGTDEITEVSSPSSAPSKGHIEAMIDDSTDYMQSQELPTNSAYGVGYNAANNRMAQGFQLPINGTVPSVEVYGKTTGAAAPDSITVRIETDSGGNPSGTLAHASGAKTLVLQNNNTYQTVTFDSPLSLSANTQYWIVLSPNGTTNTGKHFVWATFSPRQYDKGGFRQGTSSAWSTPNTVNSFLFRVNVDERTYPTLNTDVKGEMSRDGGTTWSPSTLRRVDKAIAGSDYDVLMGDVDFTGDPSGTNIKARIKTVNKDKVTVKGIAVNWQ